MGQSTPEADIFLEQDSTRFRGPVDIVADAAPTEEAIHVDPRPADITLNRINPEQSAGFNVESSDGTTVASLEHQLSQAGDQGLLRLGTDGSANSIQVESTEFAGRGVIFTENTLRTKIGAHEGPEQAIGGEISVHDPTPAPGVVFRAEQAPDPSRVSGVVELYREDVQSARFVGQDAALELLPPLTDGGGLIVAGAATNAGPEVYVDLNDGNPSVTPRVSVDGTSADVTLGREEIDSARPGVGGRVELRFGLGDRPATYLVAEAQNVGGDDRVGEVLFRRQGSSGVEPSGRLRSSSGGIQIASASGGSSLGSAAELANAGEVRLAGSVQSGHLGPATPELVTQYASVPQGGTVEVELTVGDTQGLTFEFGDQSQLNYELTASLSGYSDARLWLEIDTSAPGTSDPTVQKVAGDGSLSITNETYGGSGALATGQYPLRLREAGTSSWSGVGTLSITQP